jgi:hypothetical protein
MKKLIAGLVAGVLLGTMGTAGAMTADSWSHTSESGRWQVGQSGNIVYIRHQNRTHSLEFISCLTNKGYRSCTVEDGIHATLRLPKPGGKVCTVADPCKRPQ